MADMVSGTGVEDIHISGEAAGHLGYWVRSADYALLAGVYGMVTSIFISRAGYEISVGLLAYGVLVKLMSGKGRLSIDRANVLMAGYVLSAVLSVFFASHRNYALPFLWKTLPDIVVLYISGRLFLSAEGEDFARRVRVLLVLSLIVVSLVGVDGVYQFFVGRDFIKGNAIHDSRLTAVLGNPNEFHYMVPLMVGGVLAVKAYNSRVYKWAAGAGLATFGFTVINTQSMALFLCILGTCCVYGIYNKSYKTVIAVVALAALSATIVISNEWSQVPRFSHIFARENAAVSLSNRSDVWKMSWAKFSERPILGHGPGLFNPEFNTPEEQGKYGVKTVLVHSHNIYLQTLAEKGLVGFLVFVALSYWLYREALNRLKYAQGGVYGLALLFVLGSLTALYLSGMADMSIDDRRFSAMWTLMISFGAALISRPAASESGPLTVHP